MPFWSTILPTLGKAILGGAASGLAKRIDAQAGGKKAAQYGGSGVGGNQAVQHEYNKQYQADANTSQSASQGQVLSHQAKLASDQLNAQAGAQHREHAHQRAMQQDYLSSMGAQDGQPSPGQDPVLEFYDQLAEMPGSQYAPRDPPMTHAERRVMINRHMQDPMRQ